MSSQEGVPVASRLDAVVDFYEHVTLQRLVALQEIYAPDAVFKDPFNEVRGVDAIERIFSHMFDQVESPRFSVHTRILQDQAAMLGWVFSFRSRGREIEVRGVTHLVFDTRGRVTLHRDYWDAAEELYAKLPLIGPLMRWLARRLSS